jgi:signal peptidase II
MRLILIVALLIIAVDQLIKLLVSTYLPPGGSWSPLPGLNPFFQIVNTSNTGVAFGLFKDLGGVFIIVPLVISGVLLVYARRLREDQRFLALSLGFILGGALGNVVDRIRLGHVIDFFDVGLGTLRNASNLADWSIVLGAILLALAMLREERKQQSPSPATDLESQHTT